MVNNLMLAFSTFISGLVRTRTHGFDSTPATVSQIPTLAKSEPLVLLGVVRSRPDPPKMLRVDRSLPELELATASYFGHCIAIFILILI